MVGKIKFGNSDGATCPLGVSGTRLKANSLRGLEGVPLLAPLLSSSSVSLPCREVHVRSRRRGVDSATVRTYICNRCTFLHFLQPKYRRCKRCNGIKRENKIPRRGGQEVASTDLAGIEAKKKRGGRRSRWLGRTRLRVIQSPTSRRHSVGDEETKMKGWFNRDDDGKVIIDTKGFVTITCEGNAPR